MQQAAVQMLQLNGQSPSNPSGAQISSQVFRKGGFVTVNPSRPQPPSHAHNGTTFSHAPPPPPAWETAAAIPVSSTSSATSSAAQTPGPTTSGQSPPYSIPPTPSSAPSSVNPRPPPPRKGGAKRVGTEVSQGDLDAIDFFTIDSLPPESAPNIQALLGSRFYRPDLLDAVASFGGSSSSSTEDISGMSAARAAVGEDDMDVDEERMPASSMSSPPSVRRDSSVGVGKERNRLMDAQAAALRVSAPTTGIASRLPPPTPASAISTASSISHIHATPTPAGNGPQTTSDAAIAQKRITIPVPELHRPSSAVTIPPAAAHPEPTPASGNALKKTGDASTSNSSNSSRSSLSDWYESGADPTQVSRSGTASSSSSSASPFSGASASGDETEDSFDGDGRGDEEDDEEEDEEEEDEVEDLEEYEVRSSDGGRGGGGSAGGSSWMPGGANGGAGGGAGGRGNGNSGGGRSERILTLDDGATLSAPSDRNLPSGLQLFHETEFDALFCLGASNARTVAESSLARYSALATGDSKRKERLLWIRVWVWRKRILDWEMGEFCVGSGDVMNAYSASAFIE
ncbi:hypothetical protein HDU67_005597 [Dinochytrium kinnereticum]|nr:hypothetical protein HDU67_005597 [Dinochytrium kinnereticum]